MEAAKQKEVFEIKDTDEGYGESQFGIFGIPVRDEM